LSLLTKIEIELIVFIKSGTSIVRQLILRILHFGSSNRKQLVIKKMAVISCLYKIIT